ncbi:DUF350 domain-containing protein [Eisenibacter elegans]|uniref:DUF350 domain-containing protein n=1 Tax=Eisenibacter elegans TaxID=997 RepID=UPI0003F576FB|nr:DUF350 domain-containing protein [Eisenibacter elegans]
MKYYFFLSNVPLQQGIIESLIYTGIGLILMILSFKVIDLLTPGSLRQQIAKEGNVALAIMVGSFVLAIALIISRVIGGN